MGTRIKSVYVKLDLRTYIVEYTYLLLDLIWAFEKSINSPIFTNQKKYDLKDLKVMKYKSP